MKVTEVKNPLRTTTVSNTSERSERE